MEPLMAIAGVVFVAVISPGPNNIIVMRNAAIHGLKGAAITIGCVVGGTLVLLGFVASGAALIFRAVPDLASAVTFTGIGYLCFLGLKMMLAEYGPSQPASVSRAQPFPVSVLGLFSFQFLNPKSWVIVMTAISHVTGQQEPVSFPASLVPVFVVVPTLCLSVWAIAGVALSETLKQPPVRRWFDRVMGILLIVSGLMLLP